MWAWIGIIVAVVVAILLVRKSWGDMKAGVGSFMFDANHQARSSTMMWIAFITVALPFLVVTLVHAFVKPIIDEKLTSWFSSGATIIFGASAGLHGVKTWLYGKNGNHPPSVPPPAVTP